MNETVVTVRGRVVGDVTVKKTNTGSTVASFRVVSTERKQDEDGRWVNGDSSFYQVSCFGALAHNVGASIRRTHPVLVSGILRVREYVSHEKVVKSPEINANSVGHDLCLGTAEFGGRRQAARTPEEALAAELAESTTMAEERAEAWLNGEVTEEKEELAEVVEMSGAGSA